MVKVHRNETDNYMALMKYVEIHVSDDMLGEILQFGLNGENWSWHLNKVVMDDGWINDFLAGRALTVEEGHQQAYTFTKNDFFIGLSYLLRNYPKVFCLYRLWNNMKINGGHETLVFQIHSNFNDKDLARIGNYIIQYALWHEIRYPAEETKLWWEC